MNRFFVLSAAVLLTAQAEPALAQVTAINVHGKLSNGNFVSAACTVGINGQVTGTGVLYGTNPSNGYTYQYPFTINKASTAPGVIYLSGNFTAGPPIVLRATVPNGPLVFTYLVGGTNYTLTGTGTVTFK